MSKFPMIFLTCANCQSPNCVADTAFREEIEGGNKDIPILPIHCLDQETRLLQDPAKAKFAIPALLLYWDICARCGQRRLVRAEKVSLPVQTVQSPVSSLRPKNPFGRIN